MAAKRGPNRSIITRERVRIAGGRLKWLLTLECGHHVLRQMDSLVARCGHCDEAVRSLPAPETEETQG